MLDNGDPGKLQKPLAGATLCCTGIAPERRAEVASIAMQMGAAHKLDLTSDVTHLIVGSIDSQKYEYVARCREDVKVVLPEWLEALRISWMSAERVDVEALEREYRVPTFHKMKISLTGFSDPEERRFIQEAIQKNGAEYHGDLTKSVTHLIAAMPSGNKYDHATQWKLTIVSYEWLRDSIDRGMALNPDKYHPTLPVEERGKGAWERARNSSPTLGKRARDTEQYLLAEDPNANRRKLRRSASSKVGSQSQSFWAGIMAGGLERNKDEEDDWTDPNVTRPEPRTSGATKLCTMTAAPLPGDLGSDTSSEEDLPPLRSIRNPTVKTRDGLFQGRIIFLFGFDEKKTSILNEHLNSNNATVVRDRAELENASPEELERGYVVIPHDQPFDRASLPEAAGRLTPVTNWWVEQCLHNKRLYDPTESILCRPFASLSINGFDHLTINVSGFTGMDLRHVTMAIPLFGANFDENLSPKVSVLLCNAQTKPSLEKLRFAMQHDIPAVTTTWLWDCINTGHVQPFNRYFLNDDRSRTRNNGKPIYTKVPTAPVSDAEPNRRLPHLKQPPKARLGTHAHILDLAPSAAPTLSTTVEDEAQDAAFGETDNFGALNFDESAAIPLQEIGPEVNSLRRPSVASNLSTKSKSRSASRTPSEAQAPASAPTAITKKLSEATSGLLAPEPSEPGPKPNHTAIMMEILARRKAASAANTGTESIGVEKTKRRKRKLGRAPSNTGSNPSTAETSSGAQNSESIPTVGPHSGADGDDHDRDFDFVAIGTEERRKDESQETQHSQSLIYEGPEVQAAREHMIRAMGGTVRGGGTVLEPIGVVKDVTVDGIGGRGIRKKRR